MSPTRTTEDEMIRWLMQTVHRAYHGEHDGLMESCPKDICASTRHFFAERAERASRDSLPYVAPEPEPTRRVRDIACPECRTTMAYDPWSGTFICQACIPNTLKGAPGWTPKLTPEMNAMLEPLRRANRELDAEEAAAAPDERTDESAASVVRSALSGGRLPTGPAQSPSSVKVQDSPTEPQERPAFGSREGFEPRTLPEAVSLASAALKAARALAEPYESSLALELVEHAHRSLAEFAARACPGADLRALYQRTGVIDPRSVFSDSPTREEP